ncbi:MULTISPECIES: hypothetical protein [Ralstonia solanacearum species complex]|uniref:hypothetical protein n=1 Tax=Ralstonia solanacearum species complex TaxID=3116862 RepID=UPI0011123484|nr:hypothetical protein [Ralstonia solanacearum]MDN4065633.1 hypothetical protein [Ralstonia solanacearum]NUU73376.1 hypothetical protein [Ralstonia solanacearum]QHB59498.1 hypothetical protein GRD98_10665 [Ralstonia solanacearum]
MTQNNKFCLTGLKVNQLSRKSSPSCPTRINVSPPTRLMPSLPFGAGSQKRSTPMTEQSPLPTDEDIWEELLHSEASKQFLDKLIKKVQEFVEQQTH